MGLITHSVLLRAEPGWRGLL